MDLALLGQISTKLDTSLTPGSEREVLISRTSREGLDGGQLSQTPAGPQGRSSNASETKLPARKPRGKGKGTSHSRKKDEHHIPRPRNAFILFRCHVVANNLVPEELEKDHRNISRIISHMWNSLSEADRDVWQGEAQKEKEEHARLYPDYKYQPVYRKPVTVKRNVARPEGVEQQCERAADLIMKMCGDCGIAREGDKGPISQSQKRKEERRRRAQAKAAARGNQATSRRSRLQRNGSYSTTSDASQGIADDMDSEMEGMNRDTPHVHPCDVAISIAGDLATSVEPHFLVQQQPHLTQHEQLWGHSTAAQQHYHDQQDNQARAWEAYLRQTNSTLNSTDFVESALWDGHARASSLGSHYTPCLAVHMSGLAQRQTSASTRKAPPPPLFHTTSTPMYHQGIHIQRNGAPGQHTSTNLVPTLSSLGHRPRSMETPTPRAISFAASPMRLPSHFPNDVALISPLKGGFRRGSGSWQHWSAPAVAGIETLDQHNVYPYRHHAKRPSYAGAPTPKKAFAPEPIATSNASDYVITAGNAIDEERLLHEAIHEATASYGSNDRAVNLPVLLHEAHNTAFGLDQSSCGYGIPMSTEEGVFHFAPDFLNGAHNDLGNASSPGSAVHMPSHSGTSAGDVQDLFSTPSPMSSGCGGGAYFSGGLDHKNSFCIERPSSSASGDSFSSAGSTHHRFVSVTSPTTARASSFSHADIARKVGQRILGRWGNQALSAGQTQSLRASLDSANNTINTFNHDDEEVETLIDLDSSTGRTDGNLHRYHRSVTSNPSPIIVSFDSCTHQPGHAGSQAQHFSQMLSEPASGASTWDLYGNEDVVGRPVQISSLDEAFVEMLQGQRTPDTTTDDGRGGNVATSVGDSPTHPSQGALHVPTSLPYGGAAMLGSAPSSSICSSAPLAAFSRVGSHVQDVDEGVGELFSPTLLRTPYSIMGQWSTTPDHSPSGISPTAVFQQQQKVRQETSLPKASTHPLHFDQEQSVPQDCILHPAPLHLAMCDPVHSGYPY